MATRTRTRMQMEGRARARAGDGPGGSAGVGHVSQGRALEEFPWLAAMAALAVVAHGSAAGAGCAERATAPHRSSPPPTASSRTRRTRTPRPSQPPWRIWSRFLAPANPQSTPVDPIPVRRLDRAMLDALDPSANHSIRLGHSSILLKLRGTYWLIDPVFGERISPLSFAGPKRFHAPPLALGELPPIEGLFLSHDHYDHLDQPTIEDLARSRAALLRAAGRGPAPARHGRGGRAHRRSSTGGKAAAMPAWTSVRCRRSTSRAARRGSATARCGRAGSSRAAASASSTPATRATSPASGRSASASAASTWR